MGERLAKTPGKVGCTMNAPPVALTIAGSDSSAGAGIQADLKTFSALGIYGLTAVTCVVAEVPGRVARIQPVDPEVVAEQVRLCLDTFPVAAVKTGMLFSREIIEAVMRALPEECAPLVIDPVMVASSGDRLLQPDAVEAYRELVFPRATVMTPNLGEARVLTGRDLPDLEAMRSAALELRDRFGCAVLLKGGHLRAAEAVDVLACVDGLREFRAPFVVGVDTHGTGCTYASAVTAGLALGYSLEETVAEAKEFVTMAVREHCRWKRGGSVTDALNHHRLRGS